MATVDNIFNYGAVGPGYTFSPWKSDASNYPGTVTVKNNAIIIGWADAHNGTTAAMVVNQAINFSKYRKVQVGWHSLYDRSLTGTYLRILSKTTDYAMNSIATISVSIGEVGEMVTGELDVSALTGWYYIGVNTASWSDMNQEVLAIDYIKLIP